MFTGIITAIGKVTAEESLPQGRRFTIESTYDTSTIAIGASIAHDGVCLTVTSKTDTTYTVEAWQEALDLTTASDWQVGSSLNLERPLRAGDELGGHIVLGHIDATAEIKTIEQEGDAIRITLESPEHLSKFIAPKGSISLNGTSLTVNKVDTNFFDVLLISHSLSVTTWNEKLIGDSINLEVDMMARYAARLTQKD